MASHDLVTPPDAEVLPFRAPYAPPDEDIAAGFLHAAAFEKAAEARIDARARALVAAIRAHSGGVGGVEDFLREYSLSTKEGLALMVLAEALLRVPDAATADRLIEDKLSAGDFGAHKVRSDALLVSASAWALGISARIVGSHETPESTLHELVSRLGRPTVRTATRQAMRLLGSHFVLGQSIEEALARGAAHPKFRYSFDMLGEAARTAGDAERYYEAYARAIAAISRAAPLSRPPLAGADWPQHPVQLGERPGISVKLSALHPRYDAVSRSRVMAELAPRVMDLARAAKAGNLQLTIDAEEADRLELSLDVIAKVLADPSLS
ncbi:MAG: proline dehydrogenase family protein, partial [Bradyrhizobiaceae bacterium]|nr:proline dehydrogenase family protein [Bradyrhizobiaceae bacterium]